MQHTIQFTDNPDIAVAQRLARQLVDDDCSPVEIGDTITDAFPDIDLQCIAFIEVLLAQAQQQSRKSHRLRTLSRWNRPA